MYFKFISNYLMLIWKYYIVLQTYFLFRILMTYFFVTSETFQPICYILEYKVLCQTNLYEETFTKWNWNHILRREYDVAFELWINRNEFENLFGKSSSAFFNENKWVLMLPQKALFLGVMIPCEKVSELTIITTRNLLKRFFFFTHKSVIAYTHTHTRLNDSPETETFKCFTEVKKFSLHIVIVRVWIDIPLHQNFFLTWGSLWASFLFFNQSYGNEHFFG